jgi:mono/diheme cytochrome c family protein
MELKSRCDLQDFTRTEPSKTYAYATFSVPNWINKYPKITKFQGIYVDIKLSARNSAPKTKHQSLALFRVELVRATVLSVGSEKQTAHGQGDQANNDAKQNGFDHGCLLKAGGIARGLCVKLNDFRFIVRPRGFDRQQIAHGLQQIVAHTCRNPVTGVLQAWGDLVKFCIGLIDLSLRLMLLQNPTHKPLSNTTAVDSLPTRPWIRPLLLMVSLLGLAVGLMGLYAINRPSPYSEYVRNVLALPGERTQGAAIFSMNCAVCHGSLANGLVGPSLKNVSARKSPAALIEQVTSGKTPPMPQFQPEPQVMADLLSYLESL